jgi:hypothetical protein
VERELSARLDGTADSNLDEVISGHLAGCVTCRSFEAGAVTIREGLRLEVAEDVPPHLLGKIMELVEAGEPARSSRPWQMPRTRPLAAAFLLGALVAAIAVGGIVPRGPRPALATEIPGRIAEASAEVTGYTASFHITEHNFRPEVPVRRFRTSVFFRAPEHFRTVTTDLSEYPSTEWPQNNISLEVEQGHWRLDAPRACPRLALPACATPEREVQAVEGREPFDAYAILPTDIILPLRTLAGTDRVDVVGTAQVSGSEVVQVRLDYRDALPLFAFLRAGGSWRPFFPTDSVILSLDTKTWFPLAYQVRAGAGRERLDWAGSQGLAQDQADAVIFDARVESLTFSPTPPGAGISSSLDGARDAGFVDLSFQSLTEQIGYMPAVPADLGGLTRYRTGSYKDQSRRQEAMVSYTKGLGWIKIRQTQTWNQPALFGNVGSLASPVDLPGGGIAYYEPATETLGRRLSIHGDGWDLYVESNLPPEELLRIAGSLPVKGRPAPQEWSVRTWPGGIVREQISLDQAVSRAPYLQVPMDKPEGYEVAAVHLVKASGTEGVTLFLRRPGMEIDGVGIRIHQARGEMLPPPMDPDVSRVQLGEVTARYSPSRSEIEWVDEGVYRSITAGSLDLAGLVAMARSMSPAGKGG